MELKWVVGTAVALLVGAKVSNAEVPVVVDIMPSYDNVMMFCDSNGAKPDMWVDQLNKKRHRGEVLGLPQFNNMCLAGQSTEFLALPPWLHPSHNTLVVLHAAHNTVFFGTPIHEYKDALIALVEEAKSRKLGYVCVMPPRMAHIDRNSFFYRIVTWQICGTRTMDFQIEPYLMEGDKEDRIHMGPIGQKAYADAFWRELQYYW